MVHRREHESSLEVSATYKPLEVWLAGYLEAIKRQLSQGGQSQFGRNLCRSFEDFVISGAIQKCARDPAAPRARSGAEKGQEDRPRGRFPHVDGTNMNTYHGTEKDTNTCFCFFASNLTFLSFFRGIQRVGSLVAHCSSARSKAVNSIVAVRTQQHNLSTF